MNYSTFAKQGIRNALGVVAYIGLIALLFSNVQNVFGPDVKGPLVPMMMLLLFVVSALVTGSLVLWQPAKLLVEGKKAEAGVLLCLTGSALVVSLALVVGALLVIR
jgi:hypothetical protein